MLLYELNARLNGMTFEKITLEELIYLKKLQFDALWLMGIWQLSPLGIKLSQRHASDFCGSPYAIYEYQPNPALGDVSALRALRDRVHQAGLKLIVDFVPNHLALDTPLIDQHPGYFIQSSPRMRQEYANDYYLHMSGRRLAHGKDPYFPGWEDTVQLNYASVGLRAHMRKVLKSIATVADGVRCDMAMLVLRNQVKRQWFTRLPQEKFDELMPHEFWDEAIAETRKVNPEFLFIAEAYWDTEPYLIQLGFNYTYHKRLYDVLLGESPAQAVNHHLRHTSDAFLQHAVHFIENHDEDRAAARFSPQAGQRAAALIGLLPGMLLIHQGQMEGITEKLPVQRLKPLYPHTPDKELEAYYRTLLSVAAHPLFRNGRWAWTDSNWKDGVCFWRQDGETLALVVVPIGRKSIRLPQYLKVDLPPREWGTSVPSTARSWWKNSKPFPLGIEADTLTIKRTDVRKSLHPTLEAIVIEAVS